MAKFVRTSDNRERGFSLDSTLSGDLPSLHEEGLVRNSESNTDDGVYSFHLKTKTTHTDVHLTMTVDGIRLTDNRGTEQKFPLDSIHTWTRRYRLVVKKSLPFTVGITTLQGEIRMKASALQAQEIIQARDKLLRKSIHSDHGILVSSSDMDRWSQP